MRELAADGRGGVHVIATYRVSITSFSSLRVILACLAHRPSRSIPPIYKYGGFRALNGTRYWDPQTLRR